MRDFHIVTSPAQIPDGSKLPLGLSSHAIKLPGKSAPKATGWISNKDSLSTLHNLEWDKESQSEALS